MKIAIIGTRGIPNNYGGFEQLAEYLSLGFLKKGHESMRKIWKNYISNIDGIIYLIDSSD